MRLPTILRTPPSRADVQGALLAELAGHVDGSGQVPNAWTVWVSERDARRRAEDFPQWSASLQQQLVDELQRRGLHPSGLVTVRFSSDERLAGGEFRLTCGHADGGSAVVRRSDPLPGRPRLVLIAGGSAPQGSLAADGVDREVLLQAGCFVIGRDREADLRLHDATVSPRHVELDVAPDGERVRLRDLGSLNGTKVDGVPTVAFDLVDGSRIELGESTLVFHRDQLDEDGGRQGGEGE